MRNAFVDPLTFMFYIRTQCIRARLLRKQYLQCVLPPLVYFISLSYPILYADGLINIGCMPVVLQL